MGSTIAGSRRGRESDFMFAQHISGSNVYRYSTSGSCSIYAESPGTMVLASSNVKGRL